MLFKFQDNHSDYCGNEIIAEEGCRIGRQERAWTRRGVRGQTQDIFEENLKNLTIDCLGQEFSGQRRCQELLSYFWLKHLGKWRCYCGDEQAPHKLMGFQPA